MKEINKQHPLGRYQSMVNPFAVVFEKGVFLLQEWYLHILIDISDLKGVSTDKSLLIFSNIYRFFNKVPSSSRKSAS